MPDSLPIRTGTASDAGDQPALDRPLTITFFRDASAAEKHERAMSLRDLLPYLRDTRAESKAGLPWLKLAAFGDDRTSRGSYRHDANMRAIHGVEADYDGERLTLDRARHILGNANVAAVLYTSPSHSADAPRWRVLCPTSEPLPPTERARLLARVNGLFLGALAAESFTLSQSYYFGAIHGAQAHEVASIEGRAIDLCHDLDADAVGRPERKPQPSLPAPAPAPTPFRYDGEGTRYGLAALERECQAIRGAPDGDKHRTLNKAAYSIGGLVTAGQLVEGAAYSALAAALADIRHRCADYPHAQKTLRTAFEDGKGTPRSVPEREAQPAERVAFGIGSRPTTTHDPETGEILEPAKPPAVLWVDDAEWAETDIPKRPWVAPGYLMRGAVACLSGQGSGGKSSLVVCWTVALALGEPIGEFKPIGALRVANYNVEDDEQEQRRRYSAALQAAGKAPADIAGRVIRCGPNTIGTLFERNADTGRISPTAAMETLEALCKERGVQVLVCDPLAELHNAEENDNTAMRSVIAAFRGLAQRLNIAVLILHHDRKGTNAPGDMDRLRGASAITGAVRVLLTLTSMSTDEADRFGVPPEQRRRHFRIDGAKSNYAIAQEAEWWRLAGYPLANGEEVAACRPWSPPSVFEGLPMGDCVAALDAMIAGHPAGRPWGFDSRAKDEWAGALLTARGRTDKQAAAILNAWREAGTITVGEGESSRRGHKRTAVIDVDRAAVAEMRRQIRGDERE
jgi:hypothetical protein